jgi:4-hydroxybenzoyl-CoA reductase subunit beta
MLRLHEYRYHRPRSLPEALELLDSDGVMPIAGGTDLVPNMKHRLFTPHALVALKQLPELQGIEEVRDADVPHLRIGAGETLATIARDATVRRHFPALAGAAGLVAGPQIRNQGTIGGNLCLDTRCTYYNQTHFWRQALGFCLKKDGDVCHVTRVGKKCVAAHSADTPPVLMTLGAWAVLASPDGQRAVPIRDFFVADGIWNSVRSPREVVVAIGVPLPSPGLRTVYRKVRQRASIDFPLLSIAAAVALGDDGAVRGIDLVVSGLGARPREITGLDSIVAGRRLEDVVEAVAAQAHKQCHPLESIIVDADWRRAMVPVYVRRALQETLG